MAAGRFSQAISEGDGISVVVEVHDAESARAAEGEGAEALVVRGDVQGVREATELPILWRAAGPAAGAARVRARACLVVLGAPCEGGGPPQRRAARARRPPRGG